MFVCSKCGSENHPGISYFEKAEEPGKIWITCKECGTFGLHPYEGARNLDLGALRRQGLAVVDAMGSVYENAREAAMHFVVRPIPRGESEQFYVKLIARLAGMEIAREDAEKAWLSVLNHKWYMSEQAGRDVGIQVAALDFFQNFWDKCKEPPSKPEA